MERRANDEQYDHRPIEQAPEDKSVVRSLETKQVTMTKRGPVGRGLIGLLVAVALISALIGGFMGAYLVPYIYGSTPEAVFSGNQVQSSGGSEQVINISGDAVSPATAVSKKLTPSVVNISVSQGPRDSIHSGITSGVGSGVIYTSDGYIITNNHVVSGAREIVVTIGTDEVRARLVAADPETDLAIIKVDKAGLTPAEFGSTKDLQVGEPAVAIGSPFGFEHTVTSGIISALNRNVTIPDEQRGENVTYTDLIQTDAPINPGNSGGVLSDARGRVIGISTLIISSSGTNEGIGFAIPAETAKNVADQLIKSGKASHPYMGIGGRNVSDIANGNSSIPVKEGAIILEVVPGGPAEKAGLRKDDIITEVDGSPVADMDELIAAIRQKKVGDNLEITYLRNNSSNQAKLILVEKPRQ